MDEHFEHIKSDINENIKILADVISQNPVETICEYDNWYSE